MSLAYFFFSWFCLYFHWSWYLYNWIESLSYILSFFLIYSCLIISVSARAFCYLTNCIHLCLLICLFALFFHYLSHQLFLLWSSGLIKIYKVWNKFNKTPLLNIGNSFSPHWFQIIFCTQYYPLEIVTPVNNSKNNIENKGNLTVCDRFKNSKSMIAVHLKRAE